VRVNVCVCGDGWMWNSQAGTCVAQVGTESDIRQIRVVLQWPCYDDSTIIIDIDIIYVVIIWLHCTTTYVDGSLLLPTKTE